jgi:hypothetical protein
VTIDISKIDAELNELKSKIKYDNSNLEVQTSNENSIWWSTTEAMTMSASVLVFGVIVIGIIAYLIRIGSNTEELLKVFGTSLIIIYAIFLVVAGYSDEQMAPVIGLLGTIAGYILGRSSSRGGKNT